MGAKPKNILVLRFSAMGDVALLAPVLRSFLRTYSEQQITLVTRPKFSVFFQGQERLQCFPADVDAKYKGLVGLCRLFLDLRKTQPDLIVDLHDQIRTRLICFIFRLIGTRITRFRKGRGEKAALTRKENKVQAALPHTVDRYAQAFSVAGFPFKILPPPHFIIATESARMVDQWLSSKGLEKKESWFGLAPFAAHRSKIWPLENYAAFIDDVIKKMPAKFFLFGGGKREIDFFQQLAAAFPEQCMVVAGQLKLAEEISLMRKLDGMICVDSSNMHLAALAGVPTLSIWGGTHTHAGFGPYGGNNHIKVEVNVTELPCRPCSVYGVETCHRGDFACLKLSPGEVADALLIANKAVKFPT
jgi:ADP-heptose:LPS heptosyltransferase